MKKKLISNYQSSRKTPLSVDIIGLMEVRPSLRERAKASERITTKIVDFVEIFINEM
ncbi:hypothetical protein [Kordia sp. SMS9]|uniref:hypothetical protein n=1 Tax=Kordia sp. SMS9 TaxID=2282170 RepID=UPI0013B37644|nr:hypothetical protein [Kordia sp. SMS9]